MGQFETKLEDELVFESYRRFLPHLGPEDLRRDLEKLAYLVLVAHPAAIRWFTAELIGQQKGQAPLWIEQHLAERTDGPRQGSAADDHQL